MITANLGELFASSTRDVFRLEVRQAYKVVGEEARLAAWRSGALWPDAVTPWQERLKLLIPRGVRMRRVHVVELPLSEYVRWEMESYARNSTFGEEIRLVEHERAPEGVPATDFWLFDESTVVLMHYNDEGELTGRELHQGDARAYVLARDLVWQAARPLASWRDG
ncbi:DUF6879 family protein [Streptosporangium amethystogenes subsp. fukuiense]|uniref:DUF6879 family protein n=1 Tax=Streptosporangium amethystogenes subsp. fukuiense TaxID=698418 RepID=A0ABW2T9C5_9ACTN